MKNWIIDAAAIVGPRTRRKRMSRAHFGLLFICSTILVLLAIMFVWGLGAKQERMDSHKKICTLHKMESIVINRARTVLCVNDKGIVFYLRDIPWREE